MKIKGAWLSANQASTALGWTRKKWSGHSAEFQARVGSEGWAQYFIPLSEMTPGGRRIWAQALEELQVETPAEQEIDINELLNTGDSGFDISQQLKRARKEKIEREIDLLQQKLQACRAELFAEWTAMFAQQVFKAFARLKNQLTDMRLDQSQTQAFKIALEDSLVDLDRRLAELKDRGYKKEEESIDD